jgi:hypothetical protein
MNLREGRRALVNFGVTNFTSAFLYFGIGLNTVMNEILYTNLYMTLNRVAISPTNSHIRL